MRRGAAGLQLRADLFAEVGVEGGQGFVEQQDVRSSTSDRAKATRWRSPPESSEGMRDSFAFEPAPFRGPLPDAGGQSRSAAAQTRNSTLPCTVGAGKSASFGRPCDVRW